MTALLQGADLCVDATHPYAVEATRNIRAACKTAGTEYRRLLRPESPLPAGSMVFASAAHAAGFLARTQGNVLLATGAKELSAFAVLEPARLFPRVLPTREGIAACEAANVPHRNIIAMQGPFSLALNKALITQFQIRYLVTKDGGVAGGFAEKVQAAADTGAQLVVLRRPPETGETEIQILAYCKEILQWSH
ncbi:MAG: precorrin-6A reductase [Faecalibacterium sp.]